MRPDLAAFQQGVRDYWAEIGRRSLATQDREKAFPQIAERFASRNPHHLTRDDLDEIIRWKYDFDGRIRNKALAGLDTVTDREIVRLTSQIDRLTLPVSIGWFRHKFPGVGIAGISAILTAARPDLYPVIDVFALIAINAYWVFPWVDRVPRAKDGKLEPDAETYAHYAEFCRRRAADLTKQAGVVWTPRQIDMALWAIGKQVSAGKRARGCA
jgi:hypothetical protein